MPQATATSRLLEAVSSLLEFVQANFTGYASISAYADTALQSGDVFLVSHI